MERKAHRGRLWKFFGREQFLRGMWEYFSFKRAWARKIFVDAAQEKQEGLQGQWEQESPFNEVLEQVKRHVDTACNAQIMRRAYMQRSRASGKASTRNFGKKVSSVNGPLTGIRRPMTRLPWKISAVRALRRKFQKEHQLLGEVMFEHRGVHTQVLKTDAARMDDGKFIKTRWVDARKVACQEAICGSRRKLAVQPGGLFHTAHKICARCVNYSVSPCARSLIFSGGGEAGVSRDRRLEASLGSCHRR